MKNLLLFLLGACLLSATAAQAQDLFLKKNSAPPASGEQQPKKAAPLFLGTPGAGTGPAKAAPQNTIAGKPLFMDGRSNSSGTLYKAARPNAKIFELSRQSKGALTKEQQLDIAMEETRLANIQNIQRESARLQAETQATLAQWQARNDAAMAAQAAQENVIPATPAPAAQARKAAPLQNAVRRTEDDKSTLPKPVFNTQR